MKSSHFLIVIAGTLLYAVTGSLQYQLFPTCNNTGSTCLLSRECCGHTCCINGICTPSEECNPCKDMVCPHKQRCYLDTVTNVTDQPPFPVCAFENPCEKEDCGQNYKCDVIPNGDRPPTSKCTPLFDLCNGIRCSAFQQCYVTADIASTSPDFTSGSDPVLPRPVCAYSNPCVINRCQQGYQCVLDNIYEGQGHIPSATCEPIKNPCSGRICSLDEHCYFIDNNINDLVTPVGVCASMNPCAKKICRDGFQCVEKDSSPPSYECVLQTDFCENVTCIPPQKCYLEYVTCVREPCYPVATCADPDPCKSHKCSAGYECINYSEDQYTAPTAKCVNPMNPCENFTCGENQRCTFDQIYCFTTPCIPQPYCVDIDPCADVKCAVGYECVVVSTGTNTKYGQCYPVNDPCKYTICPADSNCLALRKFSSLATCYDVQTGLRKCTEIKCAVGYECVDFDNPPLSTCIQTCDICPPNTMCTKIGYPPKIACDPILYL